MTSAPNTALVGGGDPVMPTWARVDREVARSSLWAGLSAVRAAVGVVVAMAWRVARRTVLLAVVLNLAGGLATVFGIVTSARVIDELIAGGPTPERVVAALPSVVWIAVAYSLRALLDAAATASLGVTIPRVRQAAQVELHELVSGVRLVAFEDASFRELVEQGSGAGIRSIEASLRYGGTLLSSGVAVLAALVAVGSLDPWLVPVTLLVAVPAAWASAKAARIGYASFLRMVATQRLQAITGRLLTDRETAAELRAFTLREAMLGDYRLASAALGAEAVRTETRTTGVALAGRALAGVGAGAAYLALGLLLYTGRMPLALGGAAVIAMRATTGAFSSVVHTVNQFYEASFYIDLYRGLRRECRERTPPPAVRHAPADPEVIRLDGVSFTYPGQEHPALREVTLEIRRGQVVALVGENGSGKTTLAKLVAGLHAPGSGAVRWDGVDLAGCSPESVAAAVAVVSQHPARWPVSAATAVRLGRVEQVATGGDAAFAHAVEVAGVRPVVERLPAGWDTVLSREFEHGRDLSGGEWQRVGIARALFRDVPVLVADEPTAALDARAEAAVYEALRTLRDGRTCLLVTHRLANVRQADLIVVLHHGEVVERGTHEELMRLGGRYRDLYDLQSGPYAELAFRRPRPWRWSREREPAARAGRPTS
ncbi:ABC transporter ATP-binding protein [Streptosporangium saharense]|uniref:ATP-binding cassette subfamily B protein n=1 Tax=Streptosporangium saharense TaxID=1706840 RepID=A0A7W7QPG8_9ACTN|nr:ABC transporter ATP-binding protein [Streptosporangium saharense]MBB4917194.1 ATP-binding cassette subfamily B protein [Streptosporangium saharense]